ncbi:hypothetical protein HS088_TW15G01315 [Tripterygium wilfordii]|uniref:Uncharacterized protein n=1 Tax=Tripterygium wilfordii TaxID=458696 RepID=A0A7J7CP87_TRIWF|nr:uncharacterized protein LOC119980139 [Tripterygium wilfordii]KAF5735799.1 hypothetical protein HS088_TW15G01315 [Tripterygium wilfordii]
MDWWHEMRRAWFALSLRFNPASATSSKSDCAVVGDGGCCDAGLLKLQDEVQVCGYKDVEVMWSMLYAPSQQPVQIPKRRKQGHAWRALLFSNSKQDTTTASSVSSCFTFGFKSY